MNIKFGYTLEAPVEWLELLDLARALDQRSRFDFFWIADALTPNGSLDATRLEAWTALAAVAQATSRIRLGLLVSGNAYRHPSVLAKMVTTLDHISGGRAYLGLGGAWFEREHDAFGLDFGASVGERLTWLDESVGIIRRLLDGETVNHDGPRYHLVDAICRPLPVQAHLPILVGGSGPQKTLRTVARHADAWNTSGQFERVAETVATLDAHCAEIGRDPAAIERTLSFPIVIRDREADAAAAWQRLTAANGIGDAGHVPHLLGSPQLAADAIRPYLSLGFTTIICRMPAPFDRETVDRMGEVRSLLEAPILGG